MCPVIFHVGFCLENWLVFFFFFEGINFLTFFIINFSHMAEFWPEGRGQSLVSFQTQGLREPPKYIFLQANASQS